MAKKRYCIAVFPSSNMKSPLATLSGHVLGIVDRIFEILDGYADETYGQSPRRILHNMLQNNESIFGLGGLDASSSASTSSQEQANQKSSKDDSSSSCPKQKLLFEDQTKEASVSENLETTAEAGSPESVQPHEEAEVTSSSDDKTDAEMQANPKEFSETKEDINVLIGRNLVQIKSVSIIGHHESIGVEIDVDLPSIPDPSSLEKPQKDSSPSKKANCPEKSERMKNSPSISPSKCIKSIDNLSTACESLSVVDYSDQNILDFLAERLLSIFIFRKSCMEQIHNCFKKFQRDVRDFFNTINNLKFVVDYLPMANEPYATTDLLQLRNDLISKSRDMSEKAQSLLKGVEKDAGILGKCLDEIGIFEKEHAPSLSNKGESTLTVSDLKKIELRLKEICKYADGTLILKDGRREILIKSSSDFEWLVKHFVKFLIITGILKPSLLEHTQIGEGD